MDCQRSYVTGITGAFRCTIDGHQLFHHDLIPPSTRVKDFVPRDIESQYLKPWTDSQRAAFMCHEMLAGQSFSQPEIPKQIKPDLDDLDRI
ncbi:MAG: hypothetical protein R3C49_06395 [Planctomycetaceae bacterium]